MNFKESFEYLMSLSNKELRKEIENSNWNFILQELRYAGDEIERLNNIIDKAIEYIDMIQERRKDLTVEEYHNKWCKLFDYYESQCIIIDLLDILKGSDSNE